MRTLGRKLFEILGMGGEEMEQRRQLQLQGLRLFGAPCVIYVCIDRSFYLQGDSVNAWPIFSSREHHAVGY